LCNCYHRAAIIGGLAIIGGIVSTLTMVSYATIFLTTYKNVIWEGSDAGERIGWKKDMFSLYTTINRVGI